MHVKNTMRKKNTLHFAKLNAFEMSIVTKLSLETLNCFCVFYIIFYIIIYNKNKIKHFFEKKISSLRHKF